MVTLIDLIRAQAARRGQHPCLIFVPPEGPPERLSYAEYAAHCLSLASALHAEGLRRGDRILVHLDNCPAFLILFGAAAALGLVAVNTNTGNSAEEMAYCIAKARPLRAFCAPRHLPLLAAAAPDLRVIDTDSAAFHAMLAYPAQDLPEVTPETPLAVQFTSGSTSRPKGVVWTQANAVWAGEVSARHQGLTDADRHFCVLPLFHTNALSYSWLASLAAGASFIFTPKFSASRYWQIARDEGATFASITAFCYRALAAQPRPEGQSFRGWGIAFQDPLVIEEFGIPATSWWGMSETLTQGIVSPQDEPTPLGAVGKPAPEYEILIEIDGRPAREGETGEILIRGQRGLSLFLEYLDDPQANAAAFRPDGYMRTSDLATVLKGGFLRFEGRAKDMLKVAGENVAAAEIERVLSAVAGVAEVAVVGAPDPMRDEVPVGFLRLSPEADPAAVRAGAEAACAEALAPFKRPREIRILAEFPRVNLGKISKPALREMAAKPAAS